ncbi:MAG: cytochrome c, partial [Phenylobacterium sp.]
ILALAAPAMAAGPRDPVVERGRVLVQRYCAGCHAVGTSGHGLNPAAPPFRHLAERYPIENLGEALAEGILTGHPAMPEFRFGPDDVQAVIGYLTSIQVRQAASLRP